MPSIYGLKPAFQNLLRPLTRWLASRHVTANQVTIAALLLSVVAGACIATYSDKRWPLLLIPIVLFVRMALNAIDGMLAREYGMKSKLGALLNEMGDVISDTALYLPLALVPGVPAGAMVIVVLMAIISEMAGVLAIQIGAERRYDGPLGKSDRALVLGVVAMLLGLGVNAGDWLSWLLWVMVLLLGVTSINRMRSALREAK